MNDKTPSPSARTALDQSPLHQAMHEQMQDGSLFTRAIEHGQAYLRGVSNRPVDPDAAAQAALAGLDGPLPDGPGEAVAILDRLASLGGPATTAQVGGRFFGMVNGGLLPTALAARLLADTWDQNAVVHAVSPVNSRLEEVCQRWLVELLGLPQQTVAGFVSGTSMAIVCGLAAARWRLCQRLGCDINAAGLAAAPRLRLITSRHAHSTVLKGVALLGFGTDTIEYAEVDDQGRLRPETLPALDETCILILQAGNVNSGSFDPIRACCVAAQAAGAWVHIDGAFGLWAAACPNLTYLTDGLELAQSWSVDAHKTLNAPYDSGLSLCADPEAMVAALQNSGAYIPTSEHRDGMQFTPEMSRRTRAIDLWAALSFLGRSGVATLVEGLHERARQFETELKQAGFSVINDVVFNQVLLEIGDEAATEAFVAHVRASGEAWIGPSRWFDRAVVRVSLCSWATTPADVTRAVTAFVAARERG